jgi:hypothetical protein
MTNDGKNLKLTESVGEYKILMNMKNLNMYYHVCISSSTYYIKNLFFS